MADPAGGPPAFVLSGDMVFLRGGLPSRHITGDVTYTVGYDDATGRISITGNSGAATIELVGIVRDRTTVYKLNADGSRPDVTEAMWDAGALLIEPAGLYDTERHTMGLSTGQWNRYAVANFYEAYNQYGFPVAAPNGSIGFTTHQHQFWTKNPAGIWRVSGPPAGHSYIGEKSGEAAATASAQTNGDLAFFDSHLRVISNLVLAGSYLYDWKRAFPSPYRLEPDEVNSSASDVYGEVSGRRVAGAIDSHYVNQYVWLAELRLDYREPQAGVEPQFRVLTVQGLNRILEFQNLDDADADFIREVEANSVVNVVGRFFTVESFNEEADGDLRLTGTFDAAPDLQDGTNYRLRFTQNPDRFTPEDRELLNDVAEALGVHTDTDWQLTRFYSTSFLFGDSGHEPQSLVYWDDTLYGVNRFGRVNDQQLEADPNITGGAGRNATHWFAALDLNIQSWRTSDLSPDAITAWASITGNTSLGFAVDPESDGSVVVHAVFAAAANQAAFQFFTAAAADGALTMTDTLVLTAAQINAALGDVYEDLGNLRNNVFRTGIADISIIDDKLYLLVADVTRSADNRQVSVIIEYDIAGVSGSRTLTPTGVIEELQTYRDIWSFVQLAHGDLWLSTDNRIYLYQKLSAAAMVAWENVTDKPTRPTADALAGGVSQDIYLWAVEDVAEAARQHGRGSRTAERTLHPTYEVNEDATDIDDLLMSYIGNIFKVKARDLRLGPRIRVRVRPPQQSTYSIVLYPVERTSDLDYRPTGETITLGTIAANAVSPNEDAELEFAFSSANMEEVTVDTEGDAYFAFLVHNDQGNPVSSYSAFGAEETSTSVLGFDFVAKAAFNSAPTSNDNIFHSADFATSMSIDFQIEVDDAFDVEQDGHHVISVPAALDFRGLVDVQEGEDSKAIITIEGFESELDEFREAISDMGDEFLMRAGTSRYVPAALAPTRDIGNLRAGATDLGALAATDKYIYTGERNVAFHRYLIENNGGANNAGGLAASLENARQSLATPGNRWGLDIDGDHFYMGHRTGGNSEIFRWPIGDEDIARTYQASDRAEILSTTILAGTDLYDLAVRTVAINETDLDAGTYLAIVHGPIGLMHVLSLYRSINNGAFNLVAHVDISAVVPDALAPLGVTFGVVNEKLFAYALAPVSADVGDGYQVIAVDVGAEARFTGAEFTFVRQDSGGDDTSVRGIVIAEYDGSDYLFVAGNGVGEILAYRAFSYVRKGQIVRVDWPITQQAQQALGQGFVVDFPMLPNAYYDLRPSTLSNLVDSSNVARDVITFPGIAKDALLGMTLVVRMSNRFRIPLYASRGMLLDVGFDDRDDWPWSGGDEVPVLLWNGERYQSSLRQGWDIRPSDFHMEQVRENGNRPMIWVFLQDSGDDFVGITIQSLGPYDLRLTEATVSYRRDV